MVKRTGFWVVFIGIVVFAALAVLFSRLGGLVFDKPEAPSSSSTASSDRIETVADGLEIPWEIAFTGNDRALVTERPGRIRVVESGKLLSKPALTVQVTTSGEGGLMGLAVDPAYETNKFVYLFMTVSGTDKLVNRVVRYKDNGSELVEPQTILDNIPGNRNHDGGRLAFGPDKLLYITTGDAQEPSLAQDKGSLAGKILRINTDGSVPADNPFGNAVYSYGHRNPQGLAWDDKGQLYSTEHGPSGDRGLCCRDEFNEIKKGGNYGWPEVSGDEIRDGFVAPFLSSGSRDTWAPAGMAFADGSFFFAELRGTKLHRLMRTSENQHEEGRLLSNYGRLRAVVRGPDGNLYVSTSNRDGRGEPAPADDRILKIKLK